MFSVFQDRPDKKAFNMFENMFEKCSKIRKKDQKCFFLLQHRNDSLIKYFYI